MQNGQSTMERGQRTRLLRLGVRFFLAAALTASQTPGGSAPFALGWIAAAGAGAEGGAALAGAAAGALCFLPFSRALPFLAVAVLIVTAATALSGFRLLAGPLGAALAAAGLFVTVEGVYVLQALSPLARLGDCLAAAGLTGVSAWLFFPLLRGREESMPPQGLACLAGALLLAVEDLEILGFSPARALLCLLLAWAAYGQGAGTGAAYGLGLGLAADLCGGPAALTAPLGLAGLAAGNASGRRRAGLLFLLGVGAASLSQPLPLLAEAAAGVLLFWVLPFRLLSGKRVKPPRRREYAGARQDRGEDPAPWKARLNRAAGALRDLYDSLALRSPPPSDENPAILFDRAAEKVCRGCALCDVCWQREYTGTFNALNDATPYLLDRGRALAKDFPSYFSSRCIHLPELLAAINGELSAFLLRRQYRRQLEETRRTARGQYAQLSELLTATAAGLGVPAGGRRLPCRMGAALRPKEGETVCGDTVASFQTDGGLWCLLLADGMGSGEAARKESALVCRLLQQFLEAGVAPEAALKTLNSAMSLRGAEGGGFTTVDLCVYSPEAGEASFYKCGAAPSYLKKGGVVRRVTGNSLPVGLRGDLAAPDVTRAPLGPGGFAVMVSDGVADPEADEWLMNLLAGWDGRDPQDLAEAVLLESVRREKLRDDCGVQVLYCPEDGVREV